MSNQSWVVTKVCVHPFLSCWLEASVRPSERLSSCEPASVAYVMLPVPDFQRQAGLSALSQHHPLLCAWSRHVDRRAVPALLACASTLMARATALSSEYRWKQPACSTRSAACATTQSVAYIVGSLRYVRVGAWQHVWPVEARIARAY